MNRSAKLVRPAKTPPPNLLVRVELAENLDDHSAYGKAKGYPVIWDGSIFAADESIEWWCLFDGRNYGLESEWLWCTPYRIGTDWYYLPVAPGATSHAGILSGDLSQGQSAMADIYLPRKILGLTVYDRWLDAGQKILSGSHVRIYYDFGLDTSVGGRWTIDLTRCSQVD